MYHVRCCDFDLAQDGDATTLDSRWSCKPDLWSGDADACSITYSLADEQTIESLEIGEGAARNYGNLEISVTAVYLRQGSYIVMHGTYFVRTNDAKMWYSTAAIVCVYLVFDTLLCVRCRQHHLSAETRVSRAILKLKRSSRRRGNTISSAATLSEATNRTPNDESFTLAECICYRQRGHGWPQHNIRKGLQIDRRRMDTSGGGDGVH